LFINVRLSRKIGGPYGEIKEKKIKMPKAKQLPSLPTVARYAPSGEKEIALIEP